MKRKIFTLIMFFSVVFANSLDKKVIHVAAAANLSYAMESLKEAFLKQNPDYDLEINLGSSGKLSTQIINGAPFDIFLSANVDFAKKLKEQGCTITDPVVYATGKIVLFSIKKTDFKNGLEVLKDKSIKVISIANPKTAPYGTASIEALTKNGLLNDVEKKIAYAESISQVVQQIMAAADIGFIAKSTLYAKDMEKYSKEGIYWYDVNPKLYKPIRQAMVILSNAKGKEEVRKFYDFLLSEEGKAIFVKFGYGIE